METRIIIRGAVLASAPAGGATVVIEGRLIARVAPSGEAVEAQPGDWEVDADGRLVVPGGVDAHTHLAVGALLRLAALPARPTGSVSDLRSGFRAPLEERLGPADFEALSAAGALAALRAGVTCALDLCPGTLGCEGAVLPATARGVSAVGLRAALSCAVDLTRAAPGLEAVGEFAASVAGSPVLRGMVGLDGLAGSSHEALAFLSEPVKRFGLHASIGEDEADLAHAYAASSLRPLQLLASSGLLGSRTLIAHGGGLGCAEANMLARADGSIAVTPRAAQLWGSNLPSSDLLAAHDAPIALGTDGLYPDLAGEAIALSMHLRRAPSGRLPGDLLGHGIWPTAGGLATRLFGERLGVIEGGALADVVVLDWRPPFPLPEAPDGDLVLLWAGAPAAWAIVDGRVRLREGRLLGGDEVEIAARARQAAERALG